MIYGDGRMEAHTRSALAFENQVSHFEQSRRHMKSYLNRVDPKESLTRIKTLSERLSGATTTIEGTEKGLFAPPLKEIKDDLQMEDATPTAPWHIQKLAYHNQPTLDLSGLGIGNNCALTLTSKMQTLNFVEDLNLSDNNFGPESCGMLMRALAENRLRRLRLDGNHLGTEGLAAIFEACDASNKVGTALNRSRPGSIKP